MGEERSVRVTHKGVVPDQVHDLRASAWRFIFDCYAKRKGGAPHAGDEAKGPDNNDRPARRILPR